MLGADGRGGAREFFADDRAVAARLEPLARVGLGYLTLGQPLSTLSGGEAQRLRLAQALARGRPAHALRARRADDGAAPRRHRALLGCLDALLDAGASVLVVEHNLDVIRRADHVIDLGPGAGLRGGRVVYAGPPEAIAVAARFDHGGSAARRGGVIANAR